MKVSLNTISQFTDADMSVNKLIEKMNTQLGTVEQVTDLSEKYKDVIIVKIVSAEQHPNADKLRVTKIDDGGVANVPRDDNGYVQIICGAPNAREGIFAAWLPPESTVPASFDDKEPLMLSARDLRGEISQGMLAAADELAIGSDHDGILEINPDEKTANNQKVEPGASFAEVFGLNDTIIDIENKMFTHRPDLFGQLGVAREIAGIQQKSFTSPDWYSVSPEFVDAKGLKIEVFNDVPNSIHRFMAVAIKNVTVQSSPLWLQCELVRLGSKPINNVVDVTNYIMLLTAQPTHAYDYAKLRGNTLGTRMAKPGETITLLNHKTYELHESDIVIVDDKGPVGLAGIMGGGESDVSLETKDIVLEVANFDMYAVRKSSMRHGVFTDAVTRFNKGQSPLQNPYVLRLLMKLIVDIAGGEQASNVFDIKDFSDQHDAILDEKWNPNTIPVSFINDRLGTKLTDKEITILLENTEFHSHDMAQMDQICVTAPFWRTDIALPEDVVEEVGRLYGFDTTVRELPKRSIMPPPKNVLRDTKQLIRTELSKVGANEVLTYSFIHENSMTKSGQNPAHAYQISNALSPDLHYYRLSLTPSLLDKVYMNQKAGYEKFALFEIGKTHFVGEMDLDEPNIPNEDSHVAFVMAYVDKHTTPGSAYYHAKRYLEQITNLSQLSFVSLENFDTSRDEWGRQLVAPYEPKRSAVIVKNGDVYGVVGEFRQSVRRAFKLPTFTAGFELHLDAVVSPKHLYQPLSRFPSVTQDLSIELKSDVASGDVLKQARVILDDLGDEWSSSAEVVSIYQASESDKKTVSLRFTIAHYEKSLTDKDVEKILLDVQANVLAN